MDPFKAFTIVAGPSAAGSLLIVFVALGNLNQVSVAGMFAVAAMAAAPALMGIGVSYFISQTRHGGLSGSGLKGPRVDDLR